MAFTCTVPAVPTVLADDDRVSDHALGFRAGGYDGLARTVNYAVRW